MSGLYEQMNQMDAEKYKKINGWSKELILAALGGLYKPKPHFGKDIFRAHKLYLKETLKLIGL